MNDPPVAVEDAYNVFEGGTLDTVLDGLPTVLDNDSDAEGDPFTAMLVSGVNNGTLTFNADGSFIYTHDGSQTLSDRFTYKASGSGESDEATVNITIDADPTTPLGVTLSSTFEAVGVRAKFAQDSNFDNSATIQWRKAGETPWKDAYTPMIDRRQTILGEDNSANVNEARVSIVGLEPETTYEVLATWSDPDGLRGGQPSIEVVSTLSYNPPSSGP